MSRYHQALTFGIALVACCVIVIGVLVSRQLSRLAFDEDLVARTQLVLGSLEALQAVVRHPDQRRLLSEGETEGEVDLEPFIQATLHLEARLADLHAVVADRPRQARRLNAHRGLLLQYRDFLGMVVAAQRDHGIETARQMLISTREVEPIRAMDTLLGEMVFDARAIVEGRRAQRAEETQAMQQLVLLSLLLTGAGGVIVAVQVRGEVRRRRQSERDARLALREVDERVTERTRELSAANDQLEEALRTRAEALAREQQAREAAEHASELKDRFLATVSHELRTPLNAILGWAYLIRMEMLSTPQRQSAVDAIERNARAQAELINELLDLSHMMQGRLAIAATRIDLRHPVGDAVAAARPAAAARNVMLEYHASAAAVPVMGDGERLRQIASNLLSNAVKFTPPDGRVLVDLDTDGAAARLRVRDTGEGMDPEVVTHLFDPFFQGRTRAMRVGLGLGLALVKELVTLHHGTVQGSSAGKGLGAEFTVRLPLAPASSGPSASATADEHVSRTSEDVEEGAG
jgi:signal transduction histidine kinase